MIGEDTPETTNRRNGVSLVHTDFWYGTLVEECAWKMVILITKGSREFWEIGLMEVLWKMVTGILNQRFAMYIGFHGNLHGFREDWGTGTNSIESKLLQHIAAMREAFLYEIYWTPRRRTSNWTGTSEWKP